ncbi:hypothetical protein QAD02_017017 [Eretmocerus hayati]|uniref:Uncharacterized protein n=1 Tax=Eretmocerus hayati TaxID=131215 RepID=A0ACC2PCS8_9HYME|nr:hypothetical protein QAD02_017017 [Eretmocerus hayati]
MDDVCQLAELAEEQAVEQGNSNNEIESSQVSLDLEDDDIEIEHHNDIKLEKVPYTDNLFQHKFEFNRNFYKSIVGFKGIILERLRNETKTVIRVSKKKRHVVITGSVQKRIYHARRKIDQLIENSKKKSKYTHFISIPANTYEIRQNFMKFRESIMSVGEVERTGFCEGMFQKPEKLHLTICMLHLVEETDQEKAIECLCHCKTKIIDPIIQKKGPIVIEFKGLKTMESDPTKARVLYMQVHEESGFLQRISDAISDHFIQQGLSRNDHDGVKLHLTVANSFYMTRKKIENVKKHFDASTMLRDHEETHLGKIELSTFHLSNLFAKSRDGYFESVSRIKL